MTDDTPVSKVEGIKVTSDYLRGTIAEELVGDPPVFSSDSYELLKFHGIYQQDDLDVRAERKRQGLDVDDIAQPRGRQEARLSTSAVKGRRSKTR